MGAVGIFPIDRFYGERMEYGEISRFENVLKNVLRDKLSTRFPEWDFKKRIDWKVKLDDKASQNDKDSEEAAYISLFGDDITHRNVKKTNEIITSVMPYVKELKQFRDKASKTLETLKKKEISNDKNLTGAQLAIGRLNDLTSEMKFRKPICILLTGPTGCGIEPCNRCECRSFTRYSTGNSQNG